MFFQYGEYSDPTSMSHRTPNDPVARPNTREDAGHNSEAFSRSKNRQTMPSNSRFNPMSQADRNGKKRPGTPSKSPTQSTVSTATNYASPWRSPKFQAPIKKGATSEEEPRFRRTNSMAVRKDEEDKKSDRPRINFKDFRKSIANKFKKNDSKKAPLPDKSRMSAPVIKLPEASTSQPKLPKTSIASTSPKKPTIRATCSLKMQPEDRMKMFQKMGREQSMKVSNVQRMQRERQRDFMLVPGPGRACLEASTLSVANSMQSIDSMLVYSTPSRRSESLSIIDDDVEPTFKNTLTNKNVTSSQMTSMKNQNQKKDITPKLSGGPSFTSTPRLSGTVTESPTISNVRSVSEASFCLLTNNDTTPAITKPPMHHMNDTMYYSTIGISNTGRDTPSGPMSLPPRPLPIVSPASTSASTTPTPNVMNIKVKQEITEQQESASSSHCPSIASSSTPPVEMGSPLLDMQQPIFAHPDQLNNLWWVSKAIRDKQLSLEVNMPTLEKLRTRLEEIDRERNVLVETKNESPNHDDMRRMWNLSREYTQLNKDYTIVNMNVQNAQHWIPQLEMRRNELLAEGSPPTMPGPASLV